MFSFKKINSDEITKEIFDKVMAVENSSTNGYTETQMRNMWCEESKNDNFVCFYKDKIVAIITYNPYSRRRNGSIYMVNLTVLPEYRRKGIAKNLILHATKYYLNKGETKMLSLNVDKDNTSAIQLYLNVGYEIKEPICLADEDDEQYILEASIDKIINTIENNGVIKK